MTESKSFRCSTSGIRAVGLLVFACIHLCSTSGAPQFVITQKTGEHVLRGVPGLGSLGKGQSLPVGASMFVREDSGLEAKLDSGELLRLGRLTNIALKEPRELWIHKGAVLLYLPPEAAAFKLTSPLSGVTVEGSGALMLGVTESGGLKAVGIHGSVDLLLSNAERQSLGAGELIFVFTEGRGFSRKVDVELATLIQTATLIRNFETPLSFLGELTKNARKQNRRIRDRYRALVGDATNNKEFELKIIKEE